MKGLLFAVLVIIAIIIILTVERTYSCINNTVEKLTDVECGITGEIKLPYNPLDRFILNPGTSSQGFGDISQITDFPKDDLNARHKYLAQKCDETPGCIAFASSGWLKYGVRPPGSRTPVTYPAPCNAQNCGLFIRKCAVPEPFYVELFTNRNYTHDKNKGRLLLGPGSYPNILTANGIGGPFGNDLLSSLKVPRGLRVILYQDDNFNGKYLTLGAGNYPDLSDFPFGGGYTWNDKMTSLRVEEVPA